MNEHDKERIMVEVEHRVMDQYNRDPRTVEQSIFDTLYEERRRLETEKDKGKARIESLFYERIQSEAIRSGPQRQRELLRELVRFFCREVAGHFDPRVYSLATRVIPPAMNALLNTLSPLKLVRSLPNGLSELTDQLEITGEVKALQTAARLGTAVLVSTHQSHLDSILLGFGLFRMGLPPFTYGAGLNLFSNKLIGFFMHNLGAYKVDRRKKAELYKDVLKTYAGCTMELGYHNMFFPGGTRSRSGSVEKKLKMGLLGMGLDAYIHNLIARKEKPDVFVVPCTLNYHLVLEAETLIGDHLKELGRSRYVIEDDEFSKPKVVLDFVRKLFSLSSRIHLVVSRPLDVFGNQVDEEGRSRDRRGRVIDRTRYVFRNGQPVFDRQRDEEYTRELGASIVDAFHRDTVLKSTNLVSNAMFKWLREWNSEMDLYRLLRTGGAAESVPLPQMYQRIDGTLGLLRKEEQDGRLRLDDTLKQRDAAVIVSEALAHLKTYHRRPAMVRRGDRLFHVDRNLILYYQNRLAGLCSHLAEAAQ
ncbi:MAG: 1-acyl-sn-glycerol-3-phosphate acyltransferase [bacterium]